MTTILIVDDEPQLRRALNLNLGARGYEVVEAINGEEALAYMTSHRPDAILLDLGLPGIDGLSIIETLRAWTRVPIIVLTVRDDERTKVRALDAGADDYLTKPFGMGELIARLRALLRRTSGPEPLPIVTTLDFRLDLTSHRAFVGKEETETRLTPIEWDIVGHLVQHPHRLVTYRQLVTAVWGPNHDPDQNLLRVHMTHIRRKLEPTPGLPTYFITDAGAGFRFEPGNGRPARTGDVKVAAQSRKVP